MDKKNLSKEQTLSEEELQNINGGETLGIGGSNSGSGTTKGERKIP